MANETGKEVSAAKSRGTDEREPVSEGSGMESAKEKKARKRKDWIKNLVIIFLVIMLFLTFFSQTIMNYSLAQVATQYVEQGEISPQIRGTGTVSADDPYNVTIDETRKIASVGVKVGDTVKKDTVLYTLEDVESTELENAETELTNMRVQYEQSLFSGTVPGDVISRVRAGSTPTMDEYQSQLQAAQDTVDAAKDAYDAAKAKVDSLETYQSVDASGSSYHQATPSYTKADIQAEIARLQADGEGEHADRIAELQAELASLDRDQSQLETAGSQLNEAYNGKLATAKRSQDDAQKVLDEAKEDQQELKDSINLEIALCAQRDAISDKEAEIARLRKDAVGATIKAPVAGTVSSLAYTAGESTTPQETAAVIQVAGNPMTLSFSVTADQARKVKVGDIAEPAQAWYYTQFKATLQSIHLDATDPAGKRSLTFLIESPEVTAGQSVSLVMGEAPVQYDMTVPNSAIREDNNGKFILIVESTASPLGNRYTARRVDVEVQASDDTSSAISGSLMGYEYVITTTSKPVAAGDQVRLTNGGI